MQLRDYQQSASDAVFEEWRASTSTLGVCFTGGGKTLIAADIIRRVQPMRSMVVSHRGEIIFQVKKTVEAMCGLTCDVEKAEMEVNESLFGKPQVVLAMVQTLCGKTPAGTRRMGKFDPMEFGVLICEEGHHIVASQWRDVIGYMRQNPDLRVFSYTATPDRADEEALGQLCDSVAFEYDILYGINNGWLVPVEEQMVTIAGLDFSSMRTTAGDLNGADLASAMEAERNLQGMAGATIDIVGNYKRTLCFTTTVKQAELLSDIFNRHRQGSSAVVTGKTHDETRKMLLNKFKDGDLQILCNCGVFTEGTDVPGIDVIAMGRPTKSRSLFAQCIGRGLRPLPGIVESRSSPQERLGAILASSKPSCLVIDFVGNSGRHKLICTADILGGKHSDDAVERSINRMRNAGKVRVAELLDEEEERSKKDAEERKQRETARKARLVARVRYNTQKIDPFDVFGIQPIRQRGWHDGKQLSQPQKDLMRRMGVDPDSFKSYAEAQQIFREMMRRMTKHLCSVRQAAILKARGLSTDVSYKEASRMIDQIAAKEGWSKRHPVAAKP